MPQDEMVNGVSVVELDQRIGPELLNGFDSIFG